MSEIQKDTVSLPTKCLAYMGMFEERTETAHHATTIMKAQEPTMRDANSYETNTSSF